MKRVLIAGTHSGCGKTTVACAVMAALKARGLAVSAFKCGPDYIDPMFHREVIGIPSYNLDSFFCGDNTLRYLLHEHSCSSGISVIEGVMGYYDGTDGLGSAYSLSGITDTPAVIVIDCRGMSDSLGAVMRGFTEYRKPSGIAGFIFNRLPEKLTGLAERLCSELGTQYLGFFPKTDITIGSRHLGLVTADEIADIKQKLSELGRIAEKCIDTDRIISLSERAYPSFTAPFFQPRDGRKPVIAVARDRAFCFIYEDNIETLEKLGCGIRYFSPLQDTRIPVSADGLILCGGYPELYADKLSGNTAMLNDIRRNIMNGLPTIAECGGFMYLHDSFEDMNGSAFRGAGVINGKAYRTDRLQRFGYITLTSENDNMLLKAGETLRAHEFHYFDSTACGSSMTARKNDGREWKCVHTNSHLYAGFPHLYFCADNNAAERFVNACRRYMEETGDEH